MSFCVASSSTWTSLECHLTFTSTSHHITWPWLGYSSRVGVLGQGKGSGSWLKKQLMATCPPEKSKGVPFYKSYKSIDMNSYFGFHCFCFHCQNFCQLLLSENQSSLTAARFSLRWTQYITASPSSPLSSPPSWPPASPSSPTWDWDWQRAEGGLSPKGRLKVKGDYTKRGHRRRQL